MREPLWYGMRGIVGAWMNLGGPFGNWIRNYKLYNSDRKSKGVLLIFDHVEKYNKKVVLSQQEKVFYCEGHDASKNFTCDIKW